LDYPATPTAVQAKCQRLLAIAERDADASTNVNTKIATKRQHQRASSIRPRRTP
jgi:hypothetical protein